MGAILPGGKIRPFPRCFSAVLTDYVDRNGQRLDTRSRARVLLPPASEVVEMALAHAITNKIEAAYRRGHLLAKRFALMEAWAAYACPLPPVDSVGGA